MIVVTASEILAGSILLLAFAALAIVQARTTWKQWRCKHAEFHENGQCHAICRACGKDLGFIGRVREERAALTKTQPSTD